MHGVLTNKLLPALLRGLTPTEEPAYHESGVYSENCEEVHSHYYFEVEQLEWLVSVQGKDSKTRLVAPGSNLVVDDGQVRYDVVLLDNRKTTRSTCRKDFPSTWSFAAIRLPRKQAEPLQSSASSSPRRSNEDAAAGERTGRVGATQR